jgi:hypothetical protein
MQEKLTQFWCGTLKAWRDFSLMELKIMLILKEFIKTQIPQDKNCITCVVILHHSCSAGRFWRSCHLGCDDVWSEKNSSVYRLSQSSESQSNSSKEIRIKQQAANSSGSFAFHQLFAWLLLQPWRWRQYVPRDHHYTSTALDGITFQKTLLFIASLRESSNITKFHLSSSDKSVKMCGVLIGGN